MLRLHLTGYAQHERARKPLVLSVAERSRRAHEGGVQRLGRLFPSYFKRDSHRSLLFAVPRRVWRISAVLACLIASASLAHAHGGMAGPEELGPPIVTSGLLGFVCYWLVILWPSSKKKSDTEVGSGTQNKSATRTRRLSHKNSAHVKRVSRLRKIERSGQVGSNVNSGRKAIDG